LGGQDASGDVFGTSVDPLEIVLLSSGPGYGEAELEEDGQTGEGKDAASSQSAVTRRALR
jgi:hypothetical protein